MILLDKSNIGKTVYVDGERRVIDLICPGGFKFMAKLEKPKQGKNKASEIREYVIEDVQGTFDGSLHVSLTGGQTWVDISIK